MHARRFTRYLVPIVALVATALPAALTPAQASTVPPGATWEEVYFPSGDGTQLHADVFLPEDLAKGERIPTILAIGPYFGSAGQTGPSTPMNSGPTIRFPELFTEGHIIERHYAHVQVDLRGFGSSEGCFDFGGPGEQMDVKAAVEHFASQPWSNGKVALWGKSYDGWTGVMGLATDPKGLAAAIIQSPIIDGYRTLYMNGVHYDAGWYATPSLYTAIDLQPPSLADNPDEYIHALSGTAMNPDCYVENETQTANPNRDSAFWRERDIVDAAASNDHVAVLWSHGFMDANTKPDNIFDVYSRLQGPKRAWLGQWDHVRGNEDEFVGRDGFMKEAMRWLDRYIKGESRSEAPVHRDPNVRIQQMDGSWRVEKQWPPSDAKRYALPLGEGDYTDAPNNAAQSTPNGEGVWTFTQELPYDVHIAGESKLTVEATPSGPTANLIALVYDVDQDGEGTLITRGAHAVQGSGKTVFKLYPQDWRLGAGHRIGVLITGSDIDWFNPPHTGLPVHVAGGKLSVPFLRIARNDFTKGGPADAMTSRSPITIDPQTIESRTIEADLPPKLRGSGGGTAPSLRYKKLATYGFEDGVQGWTTESHSGGLPPDGQWERGSGGHESGTGWHLEPYYDHQEELLISPELSTSGGAMKLAFWATTDTEPGYDFLQIEYSTDGGKEWQEAGALSGQNEDYPDFTKYEVTFEAPAGPLQVRFGLTSDTNTSFPLYNGVAVDDIAVSISR